MAQIHGKNTFVSLDADDLSTFANSVEFGREAEAHDTTTFGSGSKTYQGGLKDGSATISGVYDSSATGPRAIVEPLLGTTVELIYQPEGVGTGKPTKTVDVVVKSYKETAPVADMVSWTSELQMSGDVANSTQV